MKNSVIYILLILTVFQMSCGADVEPLFTIEVESEFVLPPGLNTFDTHYFRIDNVPTRAKNFLGADFDKASVGRVLANRAELNARFSNIDWSIIREISIHAISPRNPEVSKEIFYHDRVELQGVKELQLLSSLSEVKDILLEDIMTLEVRINFRRTTREEIESLLTMNFVVNGAE